MIVFNNLETALQYPEVSMEQIEKKFKAKVQLLEKKVLEEQYKVDQEREKLRKRDSSFFGRLFGKTPFFDIDLAGGALESREQLLNEQNTRLKELQSAYNIMKTNPLNLLQKQWNMYELLETIKITYGRLVSAFENSLGGVEAWKEDKQRQAELMSAINTVGILRAFVPSQESLIDEISLQEYKEIFIICSLVAELQYLYVQRRSLFPKYVSDIGAWDVIKLQYEISKCNRDITEMGVIEQGITFEKYKHSIAVSTLHTQKQFYQDLLVEFVSALKRKASGAATPQTP